MKLREHQAKDVFRRYGLAVPDGRVVSGPDAAAAAAAELAAPVVLKPQLGVKGRGKAGGILFADTPEAARTAARRLLGCVVRGEVVRRLLVEARVAIEEELYAAVTIDHAARRPAVVVSRAGGVAIEEVARTSPERVLQRPLSILGGPSEDDLEAVAEVLGSDGAAVVAMLYRIFVDHDAETVEVNPLVRTTAGELVAVDAVLNVNQDSLFRHPELEALRQEMPEEDPIAEEARRNSWTYIDLDGDIGILSSGAGLTMAILDLIQRAGGRPANFLDTAQIDDEGIVEAFDLIVRAKPVRAILVNMFAGLNRCDRLAEGITRFLAEHPVDVPVVVRMIGNREEEGYHILRAAGIEPVAELEPAVEMAVAAARRAAEGGA